MPYQRINWKNGEAGGTPLNATNLNKMDAEIKQLETDKANKNNPNTTGSWTHNGDMFVNGNLRHYEGESVLHDLTVNSLDRYGEPIEFKQEINYKQNGVELDNAFGQIIENKKSIEELENKPTSAMLLESTSPLEYATNNNIVGLYAEGKSEQYISKNLYNGNNINTKEQGGLVFTPHKTNGIFDYMIVNGTLNVGSAWSERVKADLVVGKTYTVNGSTSSVGIAVYKKDDSTAIVESKGTPQTFVASEEYCWIYAIVRTSGTVVNNVKIYPMLNEGSTALPYEPYTGTPTPTNPIAIKDASGVVEAHTRNLFNPTFTKGTSYTVVCEKQADNSFTLNGTNSTTAGVFTLGTVHLEKDEPYILSGCPSGGNSSTYYLQLRTPQNTTYKDDYGNGNSFIATESGDYIVRIYFSTTTFNNVVFKPMLEQGTTASPYVEYKRNAIDIVEDCGITLRSIGNIADTLTVNEDGSAEWVQKVEVKKVKDFNWNYSPAWGAIKAFFTYFEDMMPREDHTSVVRLISDRYKSVAYNDARTTTQPSITITGDNPATAVTILDNDFTDASAFKTARGETIIYYPLATPIIHTLTKDQVDAIRQLKTYDGTTLIDAELQNVKVKYAGDTKKYIDEKDNELRDYADDKDTAILELAISEAMLYTQNMVKGLKEYKPTEEYVGTFLGEDLYRRVFVGNVTSNATTSNGQEVTWLTQKVVKMIDGHVGMYPLQRYVEANDYLRVDWFSRMMDSDYHTIPIINIHCSSNYVGLGYEIVVYYTKPYEYGTMTPPTPIVTSLDDDAEVLPMSEEGEDE